jgi:hypothetical protein
VDVVSHWATDLITAFTIFMFERQTVKTSQKCEWAVSLKKHGEAQKQNVRFGSS